MDIISRQAAIEMVEESFERGWYLMETISNIEELPAIDAVPVVRCKDCKECEIDEVFHDYWCNGRKVWKDHYCACGERRTDE